MPLEPAFIRVSGLVKRFGEVSVYEGFDLDLPRGKLISIFGPNGCGKSTLINMMAGLIPFDAGSITIGGKPVGAARVGYVFQNYRDSLMPWWSARSNIEYPLKVRGVPPKAIAERVDGLLETFEITLDLRRYPYQLSGGQQQLVAILRALVAEPDVLFLDEPFSALDYEMTLYVRDRLEAFFVASGLTTVLVSHDLEEAVYLADEIVLLSRRPTRVSDRLGFDAPRPRTPETVSTDGFVRVKAHALEVFRREAAR